MATIADIGLAHPLFGMTQLAMTGSDVGFTFQPSTKIALIIADAATTASLFFVPLATGSSGHAGMPIPVIGQPILVIESENLQGVNVTFNGTNGKNVYILEQLIHK